MKGINHILADASIASILLVLVACSEDPAENAGIDSAIVTGELSFSASEAVISESRGNEGANSRASSYQELSKDIDVNLRAYHRALNGDEMEYDGQADIPLSYVEPYRSRIAKDYYYPLSGTMDFMAYCATTDRTVTVADDFSYMEIDFGSNLNSSEDSQSEFGYVTNDDDVLYAIPVNGAPCGNDACTQELKFNHALAKLCFSIRAADSFGNNSITITGVDITRCTRSGKMTIWNDGRTENYCTWEPYDNQLYLTLTEPFALVTTPHEHFVYVVPSEQTHIRLLYEVQYENGDIKECSYINHGLDLTDCYWQPGHEYHYSYMLYEGMIEVNYMDFQGHDACTHCFIDSYIDN